MGFKDDYYSLEARLNNIAKNEKIKEFVVKKSQNGKRSEGISGGDTYIFTVLPDEYEEAVKLAERINAEKARNKQEDKFNEFMSKQEKNYDELCKPFEPREKRDVKSKPNKTKNKRFVVKNILVKVISGLLAASAVIGGVHLAKQGVEVYKGRVEEESLAKLKEALNAEKIWDNSSKTSSISGYTSIEIVGKDGKTYKYYAYVQDGKATKENDGIGNDNVISSVITVANAQGGNIFKSIMADNLIKRIEKGEVDLTYPGNTDKTLAKTPEEMEK